MDQIEEAEVGSRERKPNKELNAPSTFLSSCHHVLSNIDDTVNSITCILENSQEARSNYSCERSAIIDEYGRDIEEFDDRLEQLLHMHNEKNREKRTGVNSHHSLNFHVQKSERDGENRVFQLPPTTEEEEDASHTFDIATEETTRKKQKQITAKQKQTRKIASLETMLDSFNDMMEIEVDLVRQIDENRSDSNDQKVADLQLTLEDCQQRQSRDMIALISSFQPTAGKQLKSISRYKGKTNGLPSIERIVQDIEKVKGSPLKSGAKSCHSKTEHSCTKTKSLVEMSTQLGSAAGNQGRRNDKKLCEQILQDPEFSCSLENLPFHPTSSISSLREIVVSAALRTKKAIGSVDNVMQSDEYDDEEFESDDIEYSESSSFEVE